MNLPNKHTQDLLDCLTRSRLSFALYRLPWTDECYLVLQTSGDVEQPANIQELNGKKGFVMVPFHQSEKHPLVVIRPDVTAYDWDEISEALTSLECADAILTCRHSPGIPTPFVSEEVSKQQYTEAFERFITPLREKHFQKLVLSRSATRHISDDFSPLNAFIRACNSYPRMMIYLCHTPASGTWIGSTPEILLSGHDKEWHTVALAGTMPMQNEVMPTEWDKKNQEEQGYVTDYIRRIAKKFGNKMTEKGPYTARAGQLVHLKTDFYFLLKNANNLGNLLQELHPTPAVCGLPKENAFQFILENEGYDRSYYSGFIGWLDPEGHTDLYVNLRCMEIEAGEVTLYAGGGILASSEVESEWEETGEKMKTMRSIINPDFITK
ncbi:isochorismate synthase [Phocaeicola sp.]